jgi:hypothetical protein
MRDLSGFVQPSLPVGDKIDRVARLNIVIPAPYSAA